MTILIDELRSSLHAHLDARNQSAVLRHLNLGLPDYEPLPTIPFTGALELLRPVVARASHADDRLVILTHGKLLEVVVRLEEHLPDTRARQPSGLVVLHLNGVRVNGVHRVQRKQRLTALLHADLQCHRKVLQVHSPRRVSRRSNVNRAILVQDQATHAAWKEVESQLDGGADIAGDALHSPTDAVLRALGLLQRTLTALDSRLLFPRTLQQVLRHALTMHGLTIVVRCAVSLLAHGQPAMMAEHHLLPIRVLECPEVIQGHLGQLLLRGACDEAQPRPKVLCARSGEKPRRRPPQVARLEPELRLLLANQRLRTHHDELSAALPIADHIAVSEAARLQANRVPDVEDSKDGVFVKAASVPEAPSRHPGRLLAWPLNAAGCLRQIRAHLCCALLQRCSRRLTRLGVLEVVIAAAACKALCIAPHGFRRGTCDRIAR
mmetsp:Transcript_28393/g.59129  ORF Transcript_28393/g.59129 Transcript_28393/m.59129 type:complete len:436 (+) Transcript_28393:1849-3156(+)